MTLEPLQQAFYRPLLVYILVILAKIFGRLVLRICGFRKYISTSGLVSWYRPATVTTTMVLHQTNGNNKDDDRKRSRPLTSTLFFHGIAPAGLTAYLPMVIHGLTAEKDRPVFLFENSSISCSIGFSPLTEEQTVNGVVETLETTGAINSDLSLIGHSFGSCTVSWLIASKRLPKIRQVALLDPVAILLSEPDVMVNFLYGKQLDRIRMVASSELFTEYYLRRHFAWYNSELYVEDVNCPLLVCLSGRDNIVNSTKVIREMQRHKKEDHKVVYWEDVGHAACVTSPDKWRQIKRIMLEQELKLVKEDES